MQKSYGFGQWNGYNADDNAKNEKPCFEVKNCSNFWNRRHAEYHVNMGFDSTSFYTIRRLAGKSEFTITDKQGRVVVDVEQNIRFIALYPKNEKNRLIKCSPELQFSQF